MLILLNEINEDGTGGVSWDLYASDGCLLEEVGEGHSAKWARRNDHWLGGWGCRSLVGWSWGAGCTGGSPGEAGLVPGEVGPSYLRLLLGLVRVEHGFQGPWVWVAWRRLGEGR